VTSAGTRTDREPLPSLKGNKDFLLLWAGAGLSFLGSRVSSYAYPLIVLWATGSATAAGLVAAVAQLPYLLVQLPAGVLADRVDRRRLMAVCDVCRALVVGAVVLLVVFNGVHPVYLAVLGFVESSFTVVYRVAERAALPSVVSPGLVGPATARNEARERAAGLLGQPGAGLFAGLSAWAPFLFTAITHVLSLLMLLRIRVPLQPPKKSVRSGMLREVAESVRWLRGQRFARIGIGLIAVSNLLFPVVQLAVLVVVREHGGAELVASLVTGAAGVGGVIGALTATWWLPRISLPRLMVATHLIWALSLLVVAFATDPVVLGAVFALSAGAAAVWAVAISAYLLGIAPEDMRGRIGGAVTLLAYGPIALGSALGGAALDLLGVRQTVVVAMGAMVVLLVLAAVSRGTRSFQQDPKSHSA
jgi:MFS family permease